MVTTLNTSACVKCKWGYQRELNAFKVIDSFFNV